MRANMKDNYNLLEKRVLDVLSRTDLEELKGKLEKIQGATLCVGVGGSKVVSDYVSKVLNAKNGCVTESVEPRDMLYKNLGQYANVVVSSYGGRNYGVDVAFQNHLNKYLLSSGMRDGVNNLTYVSELEGEDSFISLGATLMPMSIMLSYYTGNDSNLIKEILESKKDYPALLSDVYEIMSGYDTKVASSFLESTMAESGIGIPVVHDKYGYCHGRSTITKTGAHSMILFDKGTELDDLLKEEFVKYYKQVLTIEGKYGDPVIDDFYFTYQAMWLAKKIAELKGKDLSRVDYSPMVKKLYHYRGEM